MDLRDCVSGDKSEVASCLEGFFVCAGVNLARRIAESDFGLAGCGSQRGTKCGLEVLVAPTCVGLCKACNVDLVWSQTS
jgi:hypothetical protein